MSSPQLIREPFLLLEAEMVFSEQMVCGHLLPQAWQWTVLMVKTVCRGHQVSLVLLVQQERLERLDLKAQRVFPAKTELTEMLALLDFKVLREQLGQ
jgi:hypothetical protein